MASDEDLREALLEVQALRQRERRALEESTALLAVLEAMTQAATPEAAVAVVLEACADLLGAEAVVLLVNAAPGYRIAGSRPATLEGATLDWPLALHRKSRTVVDLAAIPGAEAALPAPLAGMKSLVSAPLHRQEGAGALVCFQAAPAAFDATAAKMLQRLARLAAQALATQEVGALNRLLAAVIDGSSSGFAIADATRAEKPLIFVNRAFETLTGYGPTEVLGKNCRLLTAEAPDSPERARLRATVAANGAGRFLLRNRRKSGEPFWNELTLFPVTGDGGEVAYLVATQSDASVRVAAEQDRDLARRRMEEALSHTRDAFLLLGPERQIRYANAAVRMLFPAPGPDWRPGSRFDENWAAYLEGLPQSFHPLPAAILAPDLGRLGARADGAELALPDGRTFLVRVQGTGDRGTVISATNVTPLKTAEVMLRQRAAAIETAQDGIAIANADGRVVYANPSFASLTGQAAPASTLGRRWSSAYAPLDPADATRAEEEMARGGATKTLRTLARAPSHHEVSQTEVAGVGTVIVARDVTERIEEQRKRQALRDELERARRQEAISQLAAGIAHDFNNLLSAINGSAQLITGEEGAAPELKVHAQRIITAGTRAARLVNRLLDLGASDAVGTGAGAAAVFDLRAAIDEASDLMVTGMGRNVTLQIYQPETALRVEGSATDTVQVAVNLVLNSRDASDEGGTVTLTLDRVEAEPGMAPNVGRMHAGQPYARLVVRDTGCGMDAATQARVFDPYFSTKGDQGTGMGLAMVGAYAKRVGGAVTIESAPGQGTAIAVYLPLAEEGPGTPAQGSAGRFTPGTTILLVDDQPQVTDVLAAYLQKMGAEVSAVDDPALAIEAVTEDPGGWSALISDYDMPGLNGGDVVHAVRAVAPDLPILIVTALARRLSDPRITPATVQGVFAKPVDMRRLSEEVLRLTTPTPSQNDGAT